MSSRGKPLGGKYQGIYEKTLYDGTKKYVVHIKFNQPNGKVKTKVQTVNSLIEAKRLRKLAEAERTTGTISAPESIPEKPKATLVYIVEQFLASKTDRKSYGDIVRIIAGDDGILSYFGPQFDLTQIQDTDIAGFKEFLDNRRAKPTYKRFRAGNEQRKVSQSKPLKKLANKTKDSYLKYLRALLNKASKMCLIDYIPDIPLFGNHNRRELRIGLSDFHNIVKF